MTTTAQSVWHRDLEEVSELLDWLVEGGETLTWNPRDYVYFVAKPWKWGEARDRMLGERAAEEHFEALGDRDRDEGPA